MCTRRIAFSPARLALLAATFLAVTSGLVPGVIPATPVAHAAKERMRVAVMDFTNAAGDDLAHLGKGLQSMLTTDLAEVEDFELVERARLSDIRAELDLSRSKLIDKKTAVRIGKLSGASHLIVGTYTVVGDRMRIDTRMFAAESGTILHTAKVEGRKDDFFELEKDLVKQLVGATGVALSSKERARLGKIHTADFQAFEKFSQGIDLFDAQRYEDAIQAMRQASTIDAEFDLARLTLDEYERLARNMRTRADAAGVAEAELERLGEDQSRRREAEVVARLFAVAGQSGAEHHEERVLALGLLLEIYTGNYHGWEFLRRLEETGDAFAITRTREYLQQSYWTEVSEHLGEMPPFGITVQMPPTTVDEIDRVLAAMRKTMTKSAGSALDYNLDYRTHGLARSLHYDRVQQAALLERLVRHGLDHTRDETQKAKWLLTLAERYQDVLELDKSTRQLVLLGRMTKDAKLLDEAAERMEENRDLKALLEQRGPLQAYVREYLVNNVSRPRVHGIREAREVFVGKDFTEKIAREIDQERKWIRDDYLLLVDEPMWALEQDLDLRTGPRKDRYRADEIRYYLRAGAHAGSRGLLGVWGARARGDFHARFRVRYEAPRDFWMARGAKDRDALAQGSAGRARLSFLFGLRNIDTKLEYDQKTRTSRYPAPMAGYALHVEADALVIARVRAAPPKRGGEQRELVSEEVQRIRLDTRALADLDVSVEVKKGRVTVQAGGKSATVALPGYESGYLGVKIDGHGYAAWNPISLDARGQGKGKGKDQGKGQAAGKTLR
jgi:TolB-like protein